MWARLGITALTLILEKLLMPLLNISVKAWQKAQRTKDRMAQNKKKTAAIESAQTPQEAQDAIDNAS